MAHEVTLGTSNGALCKYVHSQQHVFRHACVGVTGSVGGNRKPAPVTRPRDCEAMVCHWYVTPQATAMVCNNFSLNSAFTSLHQYTMEFSCSWESTK